MADDPHAHHKAMMTSSTTVEKSVAMFEVPRVTGIRQDGSSVDVQSLLEGDAPVIFNFIFTSCQTICPILSATFSQAQGSLSDLKKKPILVSFSIDPEYDTPDRLAVYASQFRAGDDWVFVTGSSGAMLQVQKSFDAYRGDKLNHVALTYMRTGRSQPWTRFEGFLSASELVEQYSELVPAQYP